MFMVEDDKYEGRSPENGDSGNPAEEQQSRQTLAAGETAPDVQQEIEALKQERDGLYDRLLRKQAEFDNYKKRIDREKSDFMQFASADLMKELLNALDSLELALKNAATQPAA